MTFEKMVESSEIRTIGKFFKNFSFTILTNTSTSLYLSIIYLSIYLSIIYLSIYNVLNELFPFLERHKSTQENQRNLTLILEKMKMISLYF